MNTVTLQDVLAMWPWMLPLLILGVFFILAEYRDRKEYLDWRRRMANREYDAYAKSERAKNREHN